MRFEQTSGKFIAQRRVSREIVMFAVLALFLAVVSIVVYSWNGVLRSSVVLVVFLVFVYLRSYRIEVDAASERITITKRSVLRTDVKEVAFREVKKVLWSRVRLPLRKTLHRLDLMGVEHVNVLDEPFRSLDSWSAADVSRIANGIAQYARVPLEKKEF